MTLRIALLAAFPFPLPQGSQVFVGQQARALGEAGHDVTLLCYGRGEGECADVSVERIPRWLSPTPLRAGPSLGKPLADTALVAAYIAAHRRRPFDIALAHTGEAAVAGVMARRATGVPVVYVAHTLLAFA